MEVIQVTDLTDPKLTIYTDLNENQLRHIYEPKPGLFIAETDKVIDRALAAGYEAESFLVEEGMEDRFASSLFARAPQAPVYVAPYDVLTKLTGYTLTRGVLCAMRRRELPSVEMVVKDARRVVVLEDVMNPTNVGAIFRSAAALGMDAVLLTGGCADPLYRRAIRVGMGTVFQIPWTILPEKLSWPSAGMTDLKELGYATVAMALRDDSYDIRDPRIKAQEKLAIIMGTEGEGLAKETIDACTYTVKIPMYHEVDSLNVAAASAVAFWELAK